ncbi:MAG: hypothetical protein A3E78_13850 [Alphaproteobacteria bacterium RIFCSPHIGHO2_12_FULL_63_12]|nr:MAG: hypothetical protein A3E78_13850 [Alphaproteobacteria bacterium RIFCSPHIGHO2_12_FULL_63_12]
MLDARKILTELQQQAERAARELEASGAVDKAKKAASDVRERLQTDPKARTVAAGAGGLLLLGILGSRGGRRLIGDIAQTGVVAGLGALAYKTWMERQGKTVGDNPVREAQAAGFPIDHASDPEFALAVVRAMLAAAYADGVLDAHEQKTIDAAMAKSDLTTGERAMLTNEIPEAETLRLLAAAARTPHHAAELYAAAVVSAGDQNERETAFLVKLADHLGLTESESKSIRIGAAG